MLLLYKKKHHFPEDGLLIFVTNVASQLPYSLLLGDARATHTPVTEERVFYANHRALLSLGFCIK